MINSEQTPLVNINLITPHKLNPNVMSKADYIKLRGHIEKTGLYPPLVVNRRGDGFIILDGYHRYKILKELEVSPIRVDIWNIPEDEELIYLNTLNNLRGKDVFAKKKMLLEEMAVRLDSAKLDAAKEVLTGNRQELDDVFEKKKALLQKDKTDQVERPKIELDITWPQYLTPEEYGDLISFIQDNFLDTDPKKVVIVFIELLRSMSRDLKITIAEAYDVLQDQREVS